MARRKREAEVFSLSFLDCICCGFGAIVLLLVLSKTGEPVVIEHAEQDLDGLIARLEEEREEILGEVAVLNRELKSRREQVSEIEEMFARLQGDLSRVLGQFEASKQDAEVQNIIEGRLASARQDLSAEMERLLGSTFRRPPTDQVVGGVPVDSEYVIFVIDTSGSMQRHNWNRVVQKLGETLAIYPEVKGIQVMNDMGGYMFGQYADRWIPDSPGRRRAILKRLRSWSPFSNSSPVEGVKRAIGTFHSEDISISVYIFGDDFTGPSINDAVESIGRMNKKNERGERYVRIHAVGFPIPSTSPTFDRFAHLMRVIADRNGGAFVALSGDD